MPSSYGIPAQIPAGIGRLILTHLRMSKVKQKVSGCFRSEQYAFAYCRISSYLQTMANKGYNPLIAIQMALAGDVGLEGGE